MSETVYLGVLVFTPAAAVIEVLTTSALDPLFNRTFNGGYGTTVPAADGVRLEEPESIALEFFTF